MIRAIIFDLWDTIIPSNIDFGKLTKLLKLEHLSRPKFIYRYEHAVQLKHYKSFSELHRDFIKAFNKEPHELLEKELLEVYCRRSHQINFFHDVKKALLSLRKKGYKLALLSNTENLITEKLEKRLKFKKYFDVLVYSYNVGAVKPEKKMYQIVLQKLKVKPHEVLMVGDSINADVRGATKLGLHNCLINRSGRIIDYSRAKPEFEIKSLLELDMVLGALNEKK